MTTSKQLTFWEMPFSEEQVIWAEMADLKTKQNNLRRGIFQRFDELQNEIENLRNQLVLLMTKRDEK